MTSLQKWLRTIAWLRREFPAQYPIYIRSEEIRNGDYDGDARFVSRDKQFFIRINSRRPLSAKIDTLLHEWAHCLVWFGADQKEDHSDEWGLWYAKVYRAFQEWNWERKK